VLNSSKNKKLILLVLLIIVWFQGKPFAQHDTLYPPFPNHSSIGFIDSIVIQLYSVDDSVDIFYTLNGETPTISSTRYSAPIVIRETSTLKGVCVKHGVVSGLMTQKYTKKSLGIVPLNKGYQIVKTDQSQSRFDFLGRFVREKPPLQPLLSSYQDGENYYMVFMAL
jgi:hypothetical protein